MQGMTSAEVTAALAAAGNQVWIVRAGDGSEQTFVDYSEARRYARRTAGFIKSSVG